MTGSQKVIGSTPIYSTRRSQGCDLFLFLHAGIISSLAKKIVSLQIQISIIDIMKIALLGYGKMGKAIEAIAQARGHEIGTTIDNEEEWGSHQTELKECDLAIDFSFPTTAVSNIKRCFELNMPIVVGTTGWYDHLEEIIGLCREQKQALFVASNFSIGMNIMFELNRRLAQLMNDHDYQVAIAETHHIHKLDAPSGTAITLANDIVSLLDRKTEWQLKSAPNTPCAPTIGEQAVPITSYREGEVPGIHEVVYDNEIDTITLTHSAKSRKGLAQGAVLAAEYLLHKQGYYTMQDLLNIH